MKISASLFFDALNIKKAAIGHCCPTVLKISIFYKRLLNPQCLLLTRGTYRASDRPWPARPTPAFRYWSVTLILSIFQAARPCDIPVAVRSPGIHARRTRKIIVHFGAPECEGMASSMLTFITTPSLNFKPRHEIQILRDV
jgi:hypothetical protein